MSAQERFSPPADPRAVREARRRIGLLDGLPAPVVADAQLVASELVTNSLLHAGLAPGAQIDLALRIEEQRLIIEVRDHGTFSSTSRRPPRRPGGVGLEIINQLCTRWHAHDGHVIAQLALPS